jgi:hypothetical protein
LAFASQDSYILTAVLEPSPTGYFYKEFGYYNWCRLPASHDGELFYIYKWRGGSDARSHAGLTANGRHI